MGWDLFVRRGKYDDSDDDYDKKTYMSLHKYKPLEQLLHYGNSWVPFTRKKFELIIWNMGQQWLDIDPETVEEIENRFGDYHPYDSFQAFWDELDDPDDEDLQNGYGSFCSTLKMLMEIFDQFLRSDDDDDEPMVSLFLGR